jgi:hypothetical protein
MRITEGQLRRIIREELLESYPGFKDRAGNIQYKSDFEDPTFERDPDAKRTARLVKRIWQEEADHSFMDSLVKIHWIDGRKVKSIKEVIGKVEKFLTLPGKNEISTAAYLPDSGRFLSPMWGGTGVIVKGRTTFAANGMDFVRSGFTGMLPSEVLDKYKATGTSKRPTDFNPLGELNPGADYILDRESFDPSKSEAGNELIVDHWKPVAIITVREPLGVSENIFLGGLQKLGEKFSIPVVDQHMKVWESALEHKRNVKRKQLEPFPLFARDPST